jgi:hypothetical protein
MPSRRDRHPWSHDDCTMLSDMVADGFPVKAIAAALHRSPDAVIGMSRKSGLKILRGKTLAFQVQVDLAAHAKLTELAKLRRVTPNTLCRIILELASRTPKFVADLLDDADRHILADEPLPAPKVRATSKIN